LISTVFTICERLTTAYWASMTTRTGFASLRCGTRKVAGGLRWATTAVTSHVAFLGRLTEATTMKSAPRLARLPILKAGFFLAAFFVLAFTRK
jgi:hypothetical protein